MRIHLTGQLMDAWITEKNILYLAFNPKTIDEQTLTELTYYQNSHSEITLSIDGKPPIKIIDLAYEKHEMELKGD